MINPVEPMIRVNRQFNKIMVTSPSLGININNKDSAAANKKQANHVHFLPNLETIGLISKVPKIVMSIP